MSFLSRVFSRQRDVALVQPDDTKLKTRMEAAKRAHYSAAEKLKEIAKKQQSDGELARQVISDMLDRATLASEGQRNGKS